MKENIKFNDKYCLNDSRISLEAKGLYYSALSSAYENNKSINDLFDKINEDKEYIFRLIIELIKYNYVFIDILINCNNFLLLIQEVNQLSQYYNIY